MFNKFKNFLIDIFSFTCTFFTIIVAVELIFEFANKGNSIDLNLLVFFFIISVGLSIVNYLIWYTDLLGKCNYKLKNLIQYLLGLSIVCFSNDLTDSRRILFLFIYYNIIYFSLYFVFIFRQKKDVDKLNKIIMKLKEQKDE